jgi:hypothetical protein
MKKSKQQQKKKPEVHVRAVAFVAPGCYH